MKSISRLPIPDRLRRRAERQLLIARAFGRRRVLRVDADRTPLINRHDILAFVTLRNERVRLPYFLDYYRDLGVQHFLMVDNGKEEFGGEIAVRGQLEHALSQRCAKCPMDIYRMLGHRID